MHCSERPSENLQLERIAQQTDQYSGADLAHLCESAVEAALEGQPWTTATVENAVAQFTRDFSPISDMRGSAEYRMLAAQNLLRKYFEEPQRPLTETRLVGREAVLA